MVPNLDDVQRRTVEFRARKERWEPRCIARGERQHDIQIIGQPGRTVENGRGGSGNGIRNGRSVQWSDEEPEWFTRFHGETSEPVAAESRRGLPPHGGVGRRIRPGIGPAAKVDVPEPAAARDSSVRISRPVWERYRPTQQGNGCRADRLPYLVLSSRHFSRRRGRSTE